MHRRMFPMKLFSGKNVQFRSSHENISKKEKSLYKRLTAIKKKVNESFATLQSPVSRDNSAKTFGKWDSVVRVTRNFIFSSNVKRMTCRVTFTVKNKHFDGAIKRIITIKRNSWIFNRDTRQLNFNNMFFFRAPALRGTNKCSRTCVFSPNFQSACGAKIQICRTLMNRPEIVSVGVVWDSERPSLEHIMDVFATVGTSLRLSDVFHSVVDSRWGASTVHNLVGVVTYYGKHYSTFFFHTKLKVKLKIRQVLIGLYVEICFLKIQHLRGNVKKKNKNWSFSAHETEKLSIDTFFDKAFFFFYSGLDILRRCDCEGNWSSLGASRRKVSSRPLPAAALTLRDTLWNSSEYRKRAEGSDAISKSERFEDSAKK